VRVLGRISAVSAVIVVCSAHIGSPDAWYEGNAGPYHLVVQVATPGVVPGIAKVFVRVNETGVEQVTIQANRFDALAAAPPPEVAESVDSEPGTYAAPLWIMTAGSNSVTVNVRGTRGSGKAVIPVVVVASRRLALDTKLGAGLILVGIFLFVGLVTIVGAAVRESPLPPGEVPDAGRRRKARLATALSTAMLALALLGGSQWWGNEDARFTRSIYKPLTATATIVSSADGDVLDLKISDSSWIMRNDTSWLRKNGSSRWTPLIPDHGKLIHVFMIREPDMAAFAHLHPPTNDSVNFASLLRRLPPGRYRVYGDIVHESGFNETVFTKVDVPAATKEGLRASDPDDASFYSAVEPNDSHAVLDGGSVMTLDHAGTKLIEGVDAAMRISIVDAKGRPLSLEPYIGMAGHAVVTRDDGAVFVHLHPGGTISFASQMAITMREPGDTAAGRLGQRIKASEGVHRTIPIPANGIVNFPYAFPKPGKYRMWVQVKHAGQILTGVFALQVEAAGS
jgi:hypothetical protein